MSVSKEEFFGILREYASKEFEHIPKCDDEIDYEFSEEFEKKIKKLIDSIGNNKKPRKLNHRKAIAVLIAAIIVAFAGAMSVSAIREPIVDFIYKVYDGFTDLFFEGDTTNNIAYIYSLSEIPEGFVEIEQLTTDGVVYVKYENKESKKIIEFCQNITEDSSFSLDNEHGRVETVQINGQSINIYISDYGNYYYAFWNVDCYYMELIYHGVTTLEEIQNLIKLIH